MASPTLLDCLSPSANHTAIIIPREPTPVILSHREIYRHVLTFQKKLATLGITTQDAVAMAFPNGLELAVAFLATAFQRAICAPLNPAYKQDEFEFYLDDLKTALLLVPQGAIAKNGEAIKAARACGTAVAEITWDWLEVDLPKKDLGVLCRREPAILQSAKPLDTALILHTSGTTGRPKAVPLTHQNLCRTMANIQETYSLTLSDRALLVMPLFHVHGLLAGFLAPLMSRGSIIVPARFSASDFWQDFVKFKANWFTAVPTIHQILLKNALPTPMPAIRFVRSCSSPLSPTVHQQLEAVYNAPVVEAYAMTEAAHQMTSNPLPPEVRKPGSVGIPQGVTLEIKGGSGDSLPRGQIGEVCVKGENVTSGYLGDPKAVGNPFTPTGFLRTGDQGYQDKDGYLFLTGRIKELINKGGEKISPIELDNVIVQHPKIQEAISFAIDDELYGQEIAVAVVLQEGVQLSTDELLIWIRERVVKFKVPKKIFFTEKMPKTATGKVQRRLVAQEMNRSQQQAFAKAPEVLKRHTSFRTPEIEISDAEKRMVFKPLSGSLRQRIARLLRIR